MGAEPRMKLASAEPRIFGLVPPTFALVLGLGGLASGIGLLASGSPVAGGILFAGGAALSALAIDASRRWPASRLPRLAVGFADGTGRRLGLARVTAGAWGQAARRVVALRAELRSQRSERSSLISELGEAAYRGEDRAVEELRSRVGAIDKRIAACEVEMDDAVAGARERVEKERVAAEPTQEFAVPEEPPPLDEDERTRTAPTAQRRPTSARSA